MNLFRNSAKTVSNIILKSELSDYKKKLIDSSCNHGLRFYLNRGCNSVFYENVNVYFPLLSIQNHSDAKKKKFEYIIL